MNKENKETKKLINTLKRSIDNWSGDNRSMDRTIEVIPDNHIYQLTESELKELDKGFGREGEMNKSSSYFVILPNGKLVDTKTLSQSDDEAATVIMKALSAKPQKVKDLAAEKTILFDPNTAPVSSAPVSTETPANINQGTTQTGAAYTSQKEQAINNNDEEFEDELDLGSLRKVDESLEAPVWNQEKERKGLAQETSFDVDKEIFVAIRAISNIIKGR